MLSKTYDALLAAGTPEDKAREVADEIAGYQRRLSEVESDVARVQAALLAIRETMATRTWVLSVMLLQTVTILSGIAGLLRFVVH